MNDERDSLSAAIAALEAQRPALGDAAVDAAVAPLRQRLAALAPPAGAGGQQLAHVAILFVDIVGSTAMSGQLDPEDIVEVVDRALRAFTAEVQARQGRVLQFTGDGLLAVFGADQAAEQGAENAVRAGLAIIEQARRLGAEVAARHGVVGFDVRAGIDSGQVLLGAGIDAGNSIRGSAVNLAARMEQSAPAGALRISQATYDQVRGAFDVSAEAPLQVKGVAQPVSSYLVLRERPRAQRAAARGIEGLHTRMVGRDAQLAELQRASTELCAGAPALRFVSVVADAGVGKSRLLAEFERWLAVQPGLRCAVFKAQAQPQTRQQPYGLLRELIASRLDIAEDDSADAARHKLVAGLAPLFEGDDEPVALLGHLIGLDFAANPHVRGILTDPQQIRARGFHAALQVLRRIGAPALLLLDDLHWADDGTLDFLRALDAPGREHGALLVVAFTRPALYERRADWSAADASARRIDLAPLGAAHSAALADELLRQVDAAPTALRELLTGSGDGNPFFMEEIVRMLLDEGAIVRSEGDGRWRVAAQALQAAHVPSTLAGVLQARLAVLAVEERIALQQASVIGFQFWDQALAALDEQSPQALDRLAGREFVVAQPSSALDGAREFTFSHHLMHQFTYESMLKRDRRRYHARAASWLAALAAERGVEYLGATAEHHERAGEIAQAVGYYLRAAESAAARDARKAALAFARRALALVDAADLETRWQLVAMREPLLASGDDPAAHSADLDTLESLADALADDARRAEARLRRAQAFNARGDYRLAGAAAREALALAERAGTQPIAARSCATLAIALRRMGDFASARRVAEGGLARARQCEGRAIEGRLLRSLCAILAESGELLAGYELETQCLAIAREIGDRRMEVDCLNSLGDNCIRLGAYAAAREHLLVCRSLAERTGRVDTEAVVLLNLAAIDHLQGCHANCIAHAEAATRIAVTIAARDLEAAAQLPLGLARSALGEHEAARAALERSRDLFELNAGPHLALEPTAGLALLSLAQGDVPAAVAEVDKILAYLTAGGRLDGTEEPLRIRLSCWQVLASAGDARAAPLLGEAHADLMARAQRIADAGARQRFLGDVPHHAAILRAAQDAGVGAP